MYVHEMHVVSLGTVPRCMQGCDWEKCARDTHLGERGRDQCELAELLEVMCLDSRNHRTPLCPVQVLLAPTVL